MSNERTLTQLHCLTGEDADKFKTVVLATESNECEVPDETWLPDIWDTPTQTLLLDWYSEVKQVIIQNIDDKHFLEYDYFDEVTGINIVKLIPPGQFVTFCRPDVTADIDLTCDDAGEKASAHVIVVGGKV